MPKQADGALGRRPARDSRVSTEQVACLSARLQNIHNAHAGECEVCPIVTTEGIGKWREEGWLVNQIKYISFNKNPYTYNICVLI